LRAVDFLLILCICISKSIEETQSNKQTTNQPTNQLTNQPPTNQPINQPTNRPTNQTKTKHTNNNIVRKCDKQKTQKLKKKTLF
jgi:hypothetical protein